jgi:hypothetical protein
VRRANQDRIENSEADFSTGSEKGYSIIAMQGFLVDLFSVSQKKD